MSGPRPQLVALLLCEQAFQQARSHNWCIIGAFDTIQASAVPFTHGDFSVFVALSDFAGNAMVEVVLRDEEGEVVRAARGKIPRVDPGLFQTEFPFRGVEFRRAGVHTIELLAGGELIALRSFRVASAEADPEALQARARELYEQHKSQLIDDARDVWAQQPDARPIGLVAAPEAADDPHFREAMESVLGAPPPAMAFVGLIDVPLVERILARQPDQARAWLDGAPEDAGRVLPVLIALGNGYQFGYETLE